MLHKHNVDRTNLETSARHMYNTLRTTRYTIRATKYITNNEIHIQELSLVVITTPDSRRRLSFKQTARVLESSALLFLGEIVAFDSLLNLISRFQIHAEGLLGLREIYLTLLVRDGLLRVNWTASCWALQYSYRVVVIPPHGLLVILAQHDLLVNLAPNVEPSCESCTIL